MAIAANKPYLIDANINADQNPGGAGVWELPGLGVSKAAIGGRYQPIDLAAHLPRSRRSSPSHAAGGHCYESSRRLRIAPLARARTMKKREDAGSTR